MSDPVRGSYAKLPREPDRTRLLWTVWILALMFVGASLVGSLLAGLSIQTGPGDHIQAISDRSTIAPLLLPTLPSAPQNLQAVGGNGQVTLTWDPPSDDGGAPILLYTIYRGNSSGGESFLITVPLVTTYIDLTVSNGVTYYYQVSATNAVGEGPLSNEASATPNPPATVPGAPQGLGATAGDATIALVWSPPGSDGGSPITNYKIYRGNSSGGESFFTEIGNILAYLDTGLTNGHTYYYKVSAVNAVGDGPLSNEASATPTAPATKPGAPRNLQATPGDGQVTLNWQPPSNDGGSPILLYTIYRGNSSGGESFLITVPLVTTYTDATVTNGVTYYYKVSATNAIGEGPKSNEASATPSAPATPPGAPQGLSATPGDTTVSLTWSPPASDGGSPITNYKIYRGTASGGETLKATIGNVLTYTDTTVTNGVTYYYQVSAVNSVGGGPLSNEASATPISSATVPGAPQDLTATAGDTTVSLAWSPPTSNGGSPITNYLIYRGTTSEGETLVQTLPVVLAYTDSGLTNGQPYFYEVTAKNGVGQGPRSNEATATPAAGQTVPSAPRSLSAVPGDGLIGLTWLAPSSDGGSPITNHNVYRGTTPHGETQTPLATVGNVTSYTDTSAMNGVTYYYVVKAVNGVGEGGASNEASATPVAGPSAPGAPTNLQAIPGNGNVSLTWSAPSSDGGSPITTYTVYRGTNSGNQSYSVQVGTVTSYTDTGLSNGQRYYYVVTAVNALGESPPSSEVSAKPATVPGSPGNLQAIPGNGNVTIQWSGAANNGAPVTNYRVYRGTTSGQTSLVKTLGNVDTYTDTGLTNGVRYYYRVAAVNRVGEGTKSNEASASPTAGPSVPSVPRNLAATAGSGVVTLRWYAPAADGGSSIKNYTIYRGVSRDSLMVLARASALLLVDGGLTNGVTYYYEVAAVNSIGEGPRSPLVAATPKASGLGTDTIKPSIQILSPVAGASLPAGPTVVTGNASDNVGLALVEVSTDGLNWSKASGTASWTATINLTVADHTIYARATDGAGNIETATVAVTVSANGGIVPAGSDLPRSLVVTAVLSFAAAAGIAWFLLDRRRKESRRPMGSRRFRLGRNP